MTLLTEGAAAAATSQTDRKVESIRKRDGQVVDMQEWKVRSAIERAGRATSEFGTQEAIALTHKVMKVLAHRSDKNMPSVEEIQNTVEHALIEADYFDTARAYIVYREKHRQLRGDKKTLVDVCTSVNEYLDQEDWRVHANANQGYSLGGLILNLSGKVIANLLAKPCV